MFVHLHVHSHYSFLDGTLRVEEIVEAARRAGMTAVALTDTNGLYAVVPFVKACREAGIRPIVGAEIDGFDDEEIRTKDQGPGTKRSRPTVGEGGIARMKDEGGRMKDQGPGTRDGFRVSGFGGRGGVEGSGGGRFRVAGSRLGQSGRAGFSVGCSGSEKRIETQDGSEERVEIQHSEPATHHSPDFQLSTFNFQLATFNSRLPAGPSNSKFEDPCPSSLQPPASGLPPRVIVLARDREGYAQLSRLVTQRCLSEPLPGDLEIESEVRDERSEAGSGAKGGWREDGSRRRDPADSREEYGDGWVMDPAVTFSPGPRFEGSLLDSLLALSEDHVWILTDSPPLLRLLAGRDNVFAELILTRRRRGHCRRVYDLARELNIPMVATCDVHFARPDDYPLYRLLRAIGLQKTVETLDDPNWRLEAGGRRQLDSAGERERERERAGVDEEHYFKTPREVARAFRGLKAPLRNTRFIAERCDVDLGLGEWKFPRVTLPPGESAFSHLWKVTFEGLKQRYRPLTPEVTRRLEFELETIGRLGFAEYFLAVNEIVAAARARGFLILGRGSAANSIVSFALGLTPVDPLEHNLYFERFLNPERRSPPDIDLDFSWKQRDEVVRWIFDHFGHDRVALISTHITLQPRQAIREAAKAMGVAESEVNRFTRRIPGWLGEGRTLAELPVVFPECRDLPIDDEPWRSVLQYAQRLIDFPRHLSIHCGGLLITPDPITDYTPLQRAAKGPIITQMEMHAIEDLGLIKIDILSNRSLGVLHDCLQVLSDGRNRNGGRDSIDAGRLVQQP